MSQNDTVTSSLKISRYEFEKMKNNKAKNETESGNKNCIHLNVACSKSFATQIQNIETETKRITLNFKKVRLYQNRYKETTPIFTAKGYCGLCGKIGEKPNTSYNIKLLSETHIEGK